MTDNEPQWWMHLNIVRDIHWKCGSLEISLLYAWKDIQQTFQNVYSKLDWPFQHFKEREQPGHLFFLFLSVIYTDYCNHSTQLSIYWAPHNRLMQGNWCNKASLGASQHRGNDISRLTARTGGFREIVGDTFVTCGKNCSWNHITKRTSHVPLSQEKCQCYMCLGDKFGEQHTILKSGRK